MLALFITAVAVLLLMDVVVCVARLSRIQQGLYDEQYCLNEVALIVTDTASETPGCEQATSGARSAPARRYFAAA